MKKNRFVLSLLIPLLFSNCSEIQIVDVTEKTNLEKVINSQIMQYAMPGFACCAVKDSDIIYDFTYGSANKKEGLPFTLQTRMPIASISKTMIVTAAMQLMEAGQLKIENDINEYLPFSVRNPNWPDQVITVEMLLTHSSSISDDGFYFANHYLFGYVDYPESLGSFLHDYLTPGRQHYSRSNYSSNEEPGSTYDYSNVASALMAYVVECISGLDYAEYCRQNIFIPLGMTRTTFYFKDTPKEEVAIPYMDSHDNDPEKPFCSYPTYPDGHMITTVEDLSFFLRAYINNGSWKGYTLLLPETIDLILQKYIKTDWGPEQGLIFYKYPYHISDYSNTWGHTGGDSGIGTEMFFDRDRNTGYILFTNRYYDSDLVIGNALFNYAENY